MAANDHQTYLYVGLAGEGQYMAEGGLYRYAESTGAWQSMTQGLPPTPQVRALLVHPNNPAVLYAGTQCGPYRSDDRGEHWEALETPREGRDVWSLAFHPNNPEVLYAGYEPCAIYLSEDGGAHWHKMNTDNVVFPHITTYMHPVCKRVIGITADPSNPSDMYAAIEVGGLLGSRDGGESWTSLLDGPYVRNNTLDLHGVQVSAAAPGTVYIITQVAMFRGRDRGRRWEHIQVEEMFPGGLIAVASWWPQTTPRLSTWRPALGVGVPRQGRRRPARCSAAVTQVRPGSASTLVTHHRAAWRRSLSTVRHPNACTAAHNAARCT